MTVVNKSQLLKGTGWILTGIGLYLVTWGTFIDDGEPGYFNQPEQDDSIIDAEWYEVEED